MSYIIKGPGRDGKVVKSGKAALKFEDKEDGTTHYSTIDITLDLKGKPEGEYHIRYLYTAGGKQYEATDFVEYSKGKVYEKEFE